MDGLLYVFTGDGKGKTSAAIGIAFRAAGHGKKVAFFQFMKEDSPRSGEYAALSSNSRITVARFGYSMINKKNTDKVLTRDRIDKGISFIVDHIENNRVDVLILDELNVAIDKNLADIQKATELIKYKERNVDIVITGRNAPDEILKVADLITEFKKIKHPYDSGRKAKKGLDF